MLNVIQCSPSQFIKTLDVHWDLRLRIRSPFAHGEPGIGKSMMVRDWAARRAYHLIDLRLTTLEAVDLRGIPVPDRARDLTVWLKPEFFPADDAPTILFLDELTAAEPRLQASAYELVLDRRVGKHRLGDNVLVLAAGNDVEDGAIAYEMGSALADRFTHYKVTPNTGDWVSWAIEHGIHPHVIAFIQSRPDYLNGCGGQPTTDQLVRPTPRSWESVSHVLFTVNNAEIRSVMLNGIVGEAATVQFLYTIEEIGQIPPMSRLMSLSPKEAARAIPATISALYGLTYSLAAYCESLDQFERAIYILDAVTDKADNLPRAEIQTLAMELLLAKAHAKRALEKLTQTRAYKECYAHKAAEVAG